MSKIKTKQKHYDVLLVGAGLFNAVLANRLKNMGKSVLVVERRNHIAGNCYTRKDDGIDVHQYGAHIFHTSDEEVWEYVNQFAKFNNYINSPIAITYNIHTDSNLVSFVPLNMPFNMNTFAHIFSDKFNDAYFPADVARIIKEETAPYKTKIYLNLKEKALSMVGPTIYKLLVKEYTEKQWGKPCEELDPNIITRLPLRMTYDNNYFNDKYQGIPVDGYTDMIQKMLDGVEIKLGVNFIEHREQLVKMADVVYYSGCVDELGDYALGKLEYRSLKFVEKKYKTDSKQGTAVFNYCTHYHKYTRSIEHKFFNLNDKQKGTIVSYEYPVQWKKGKEPYYPVNNAKNNTLHIEYVLKLREKYPNMRFVGRLGQYKYLDMDDTIRAALNVNLEQEWSGK